MILSDHTIMYNVVDNRLAIEPLDPKQIQPASVDIRLGNTFSIVEDFPDGIITMDSKIAYKTIIADRYVFLLKMLFL